FLDVLFIFEFLTRGIWLDIKYFRNNLAHCGIGKAEKEDLSGLKNKIENLTEKFEAEIRKG
ncbi:hypothetical protein, partial [Sulfurihydrogenibium sp.]|uniref:hypothetical protein n=1 Tax=Sulfurihydrogenibium sp. TaxID=2053621 RepID=UPI0026384FCA